MKNIYRGDIVLKIVFSFSIFVDAFSRQLKKLLNDVILCPLALQLVTLFSLVKYVPARDSEGLQCQIIYSEFDIFIINLLIIGFTGSQVRMISSPKLSGQISVKVNLLFQEFLKVKDDYELVLGHQNESRTYHMPSF